jgi:bifunctional UDP-N-acetylglucosamine pyrophosphorylase/glucosamine-1-phosphate N-acetyltransferase
MEGPKVLAPISKETRIWDVLLERGLQVAEHVHVVVAPTALEVFSRVVQDDVRSGKVSVSVQPRPIGMGDAIFCGYQNWKHFDDVLVIWGDQVGLSTNTLHHVAALQETAARPALVLPLVRSEKPYVEYVFDAKDRLVGIRQSREGDACVPGGFSDVGLFGMSVDGLEAAWRAYEAHARVGERTGEKNFLPFMVHLVRSYGWSVQRYMVENPDEARGVNTVEDLEFFRRRFLKGAGT